MTRYPYYDVLVSDRTRAVRVNLTLRSARQLKKALIQQGKDAFIMKVWRHKLTNQLYEDCVR